MARKEQPPRDGPGAKIRLGISTCLLGEKVRYDGGHKLDRFLRDELGRYVEYVPVCPEYECGFGVPREAFRLVGDPERPRLITSRTKKDCTDRMLAWARQRVEKLASEDLCGFIFKKDSPSSGYKNVKVYGEKEGPPTRKGIGIFARVFIERFPLLPVTDEGRLHDEKIRENFIERIFALRRWREAGGRTRGSLVAFHTRHKLLLLAHSPAHYAEMGRLVARAKEIEPRDLRHRYERLLLEALEVFATPKKHANVLQHILGYFKDRLSADEKQEALETVDLHRRGLLPLIVPITLLAHYVRKYDQAYLKDQIYLRPHPIELRLRNHA
ncbi:MAG: DUF1722 domain-containing protein [Planctomycetes bacterium]|nr:DUF1722 domain-containing protein [Planctomycetota bacterium]